MPFTAEERKELIESEEFKDAFREALRIHRRIHDPEATHFRDCEECKCGFALLLDANLRLLKERR